MPRFAANLGTLFREQPFLDRFEAAANAGFDAVEFLFPYSWPVEQIAHQLCSQGLRLVQFCLPAGDWVGGERGIACHPDRVSEFRYGVDEAIQYARALGVRQLCCMAGRLPPGVPPEQARATLVGNLRTAAARLKPHGIALLVAPHNTADTPGFFLTGTRQALDLIRDTGSDNLFLQYDIYQMQRMEGELAATITAALPWLRHVQLADSPGCSEPGSGEINYRYLLELLDRLGYDGWVGCNYEPVAATLDSLGWLRPWMAPALSR
ncbi:hydroxypyruvate isomerase family protein [Oxalobacteraceae bacterium A2-2]